MPGTQWITVAALAAIVSAALAIASIHLLTVYVEKRLIPRWAAAAGLTAVQVRIRHVGFTGADLGPIHIELGQSAVLTIGAVQIDYWPAALLHGDIQAVVLSGLNLDLTLSDRGDAIVGWQPSRHPSARLAAAALQTMLPVGLDRIGIRNATAAIHWRGRTFRAVMAADLDTAGLSQGRLNGSMQVVLRDNRFKVTLTADARANRVDLGLSGRQVRMDAFADMVAAVFPSGASGRLDLAADAHCTLQPLSLASLTAAARLGQTRIDAGCAVLENTRGPDNGERPIVVRLSCADGRNWHWSAAPLRFSRPLRVQIERLQGDFIRDNAGWQATAAAHCRVPVQPVPVAARPGLSIARPLALRGRFTARPAADGAIVLDARAETESRSVDNTLSLQGAGAMFECPAPYLSITGRIQADQAQARLRAGMRAIEVRFPRGGARIPQPTITGDLHADGRDDIRVTLRMPDLLAEASGTTVSLPQTRLEASLARGAARDWQLKGRLDVSGGRIRSQTFGMDIRNVTLRLPLQWPAPPDGAPGTLSADPILCKAGNIGGITGNIGGIKGEAALAADGLHIDLDHASKLFAGMNVHIQSAIGPSQTMLTVTVPPFAPAKNIDLARILPAAAGVTVNGRIEARARIIERDGSATSDACIHVAQGTIRQLQRHLSIEGIAGELNLKDLATLRSAPGQRLHADRLTMGKIAARNVDIDFRIEPGRSLFIEKAALAWCRGTVQTAAARLRPDLANITATLFCDRLNLAMLLDQLGAARGSGEGSLNGRIPLRWHKGRLSFDDGFLYSTPGQTGTIQLRETRFLPAGLPSGSPQQIQLDIATEALRDYTYNWASLKLESRQDRLLISLQLDGKPNQLLPFAYHPQTGSFTRIDGRGQAEFKGIGVTLNFDAPLDDILHYRDALTPKP